MRIDALRVVNYRGIRRAEISQLAQSPIVTVSGANGAGKSLLFEAITLLWRVGQPYPGQLDYDVFLGPWGNSSEIIVDLSLTTEEQAALADYAAAAGGPVGNPPSPIRLALVLKRGEQAAGHADDWGHTLWRKEFSLAHRFAQVDYMPADRTIPRGEPVAVNPGMFRDDQSESLRLTVMGSFIGQRSMVSLTGVQPFLASLDYLDLLAEREKKPPTNDFDTIADSFEAATGKTIKRPELDLDAPSGAALRVKTAAGVQHTLDQLSSGEQEVLGLMFYVRRLRATGGLLLIDEPELHLHPALQRSLFSVLETIADRAQIWIATHSPRLVTAAPLQAILHMIPASPRDENQLSKASDEEARLQLLDDLGVHPIEVLQSDLIVVVEGPTDVQRLSAVMPLELGRAVLYKAGNASSLEATCRAFASERSPLPYVCVRDRDLLADEQAENLKATLPGLFIWSNRCLENELLHPPLLRMALQAAGTAKSEDQIRSELRSIADGHKPNILADLIEQELKSKHRYDTSSAAGLPRLEKYRAYLTSVATVAQAKLAELDTVANEVETTLNQRWNDDWFKLMDGKRAIAEYLTFTPFRTVGDLVSSVAHTLKGHPEVMPPGIEAFDDNSCSQVQRQQANRRMYPQHGERLTSFKPCSMPKVAMSGTVPKELPQLAHGAHRGRGEPDLRAFTASCRDANGSKTK